MDPNSEPLSDAHRNRIATTLTVLDRLTSQFQRWAEGQTIQSALYTEINDLDEQQRVEIRRQIEALRHRLQRLKQQWQLADTSRQVTSTIRAQCATMWEALIELDQARLRRYGPLSPQLAEQLEAELPGLIECVEAIARVVNR